MHFVNIYYCVLVFGGYEEGGWWGDRKTPVASKRFTSLRKMKKYLKRMRNIYDKLNACLPRYTSVNGGRCWEVIREESPAKYSAPGHYE